ncbi:MAG: hypothetical protein WCK51_03010 [Armatimonadota bacterium]
MELNELSLPEQRLLLELYCHEMDSAGQEILSEDLASLLKASPVDLKFSFRKLALKGLILGQSLTVRGKLFVEESGLLPASRWVEVQAIREAISVCIVETMVAEGVTEAVNLDDLCGRIPLKPGSLEFNIDVMVERGFLTLLRGNRVALGPRLRALVGK